MGHGDGGALAGGVDAAATPRACRMAARRSRFTVLARKPLLRIRTHRRGGMCCRNRRRNSSPSRVMTLLRPPSRSSFILNVTLVSLTSTSLLSPMATR